MEPVVLVDGVTRRYGATVAVRDLSFSVQKGEVLGFLGPNGAGKTTTMRIIAGFMPPSEGRVLLSGSDPAVAPLEARRKIGYLPENPPLYPEMEVEGFLEFAARLRGVPARRLGRALDRALEQCALGEARRQLIGKLSRGYRQRVGLAQALVHDPEALILDEPTAGLDPKQIHQTRRLIRSFAGERTVVLSTHILPEVAATCDRVVIIKDGELRAEDTPARLTARLREGAESGEGPGRLIEIETGSPGEAAAAQLREVPGVVSVRLGPESPEGTVTLSVETRGRADRRSELARTVLEGGGSLLGLRRASASLEEVFLDLTTDDAPPEPETGPPAEPDAIPETEPDAKRGDSGVPAARAAD